MAPGGPSRRRQARGPLLGSCRLQAPLLPFVTPGVAAALIAAGSGHASPLGVRPIAACPGPTLQLLMALTMLVASSALFSGFTMVTAEITHHPRWRDWVASRRRRRVLAVLLTAVSATLALVLVILLWGALYRVLGLFDTMEKSFYFSGITFSSVGYGDITLPPCWRLLSVGEAINGLLLGGWMTALLLNVVQWVAALRLEKEGKL